MKVDVMKCARCGGAHLDVTFKELDGPRAEYKYWAMCPVKHAPILLEEYRDAE
jgi:hypothetical protein